MINYLKIVVDNTEKATKILEEHFPELTYVIENQNQIKITENLDKTSVINQTFVNHGISVLGMETHKSTLEDYFFKLILIKNANSLILGFKRILIPYFHYYIF